MDDVWRVGASALYEEARERVSVMMGRFRERALPLMAWIITCMSRAKINLKDTPFDKLFRVECETGRVLRNSRSTLAILSASSNPSAAISVTYRDVLCVARILAKNEHFAYVRGKYEIAAYVHVLNCVALHIKVNGGLGRSLPKIQLSQIVSQLAGKYAYPKELRDFIAYAVDASRRP